jgi:hypothetical protein
VRKQVSLLLDHGHPHAGLYPIGRVWDEASLVVERENRRLKTEAILIQAAAGSIISEQVGKQFDELVEGLDGDE